MVEIVLKRPLIHLYLAMHCTYCDTICSSTVFHITACDIFANNAHDINTNSFFVIKALINMRIASNDKVTSAHLRSQHKV